MALIRPHLDERAWRLLVGAEAKALGRGGISVVAKVTGAHPDTVSQGVRELDYPEPIPGRVRRPGAGRHSLAVTDPELAAALDALEPSSRGDPGSRRCVDDEVDRAPVGGVDRAEASGIGPTVAKLLKATGYSLQGELENRTRHELHGDGNYSITPRDTPTAPN